jgi:hypothetical protein
VRRDERSRSGASVFGCDIEFKHEGDYTIFGIRDWETGVSS